MYALVGRSNHREEGQCNVVLAVAARLLSWFADVMKEGSSMARPAQAVVGTSCKPATLHEFWRQSVLAVAHFWKLGECRFSFPNGTEQHVLP